MSNRVIVIRSAAGLALCLAVAAATVGPRISRAGLVPLERESDTSFESLLKEDPMSILGQTRGVYLDGYGVVFSAEVDLAPRMTPNPFRPSFTKQDYARIRETKKARLSLLQEHMQSMLIRYATSLETMPLTDNVALAVTIPYSKLEDTAGMTRQLVMAAPRKALLEARSGNRAPLTAALKVQEFF